ALARQLPEYMVPALIVRLDGLPLNANGKVDRKALPQPQGIERVYEAPQGEVEEQLAAIWAEVLGIERVGRHDNFFEIGGHSLAALRIVAACDARFGSGTLSVGEAIQNSVLREQAQMIATPDPCGTREQDDLRAARRGGVARGVPLFCFPGLHVNRTEYDGIVKAVAGDRAVYTFDCYTLSRARWKAWRFEELAARYAEQVLELGERGPVALLGWSSGGDLAYEVGRQLKDRIPVAFVGMLDVCHPVGAYAATEGGEALRFDEAFATWREQSRMAPHWRRLLDPLEPGEKALIQDLVRKQWSPLPLDGPALGSEEFAAFAGIGHSIMMRRYCWEPCELPIHAWHADDTLTRKSAEVRDWSELSKLLLDRVVDACDHRSLLVNPGFLAELRECLEASERCYGKELYGRIG
ncbi:thioesterase domain-containing protein, partial [Roseateles sp. BYS180W]